MDSIGVNTATLIGLFFLTIAIIVIILRNDQPWVTRRYARIPVEVNQGRRRRTRRMPPPEEEAADNNPFAVYLGILFFAYLMIIFLRYA